MVIISDIKQIERPNFYIFLCQFCRTSFAAGTGKRIREALSSAPAPAMAYKGIHKVKLKNALNEKRKKLLTWVFFFYKYGRFWSVSPDKTIDLKPLFFWRVGSYISLAHLYFHSLLLLGNFFFSSRYQNLRNVCEH